MANKRSYNPRDKYIMPKMEEQTPTTPNDLQEEQLDQDKRDFELAKTVAELEKTPVTPPQETKVIEDVNVVPKEPAKPLYNFSRDINGKVKIETAKTNESKETKTTINKKQAVLAEMLVHIDKDILKTEIEIEIHQELNKNINDLLEEHNVQRKLISYHTNLDYLKKKKEILIKIIKKANS